MLLQQFFLRVAVGRHLWSLVGQKWDKEGPGLHHRSVSITSTLFLVILIYFVFFRHGRDGPWKICFCTTVQPVRNQITDTLIYDGDDDDDDDDDYQEKLTARGLVGSNGSDTKRSQGGSCWHLRRCQVIKTYIEISKRRITKSLKTVAHNSPPILTAVIPAPYKTQLPHKHIFKSTCHIYVWTYYAGSWSTLILDKHVRGTDGQQFHPMVQPGEELWLFEPDLCRSIPVTQVKMRSKKTSRC